MRFLKLICFVSSLLTATAANAIESPSLELGKALFQATELGTKQRSCSTCHPNGKGLEMIGDFTDQELKDIINACIRDALDGKMLAIDSQEMDALTGYIRSFQKAD